MILGKREKQLNAARLADKKKGGGSLDLSSSESEVDKVRRSPRKPQPKPDVQIQSKLLSRM